jgi:hypothetical protein
VIRGVGTLLATALLVAGCGGSNKSASTPSATTTQPPSVQGNERGVLATIDALQSAARAGNSRKICSELFTADLRRSIGGASQGGCAAAVRKHFDPKTVISVGRDFKVTGSTATVVIRDQHGRMSTLRLVRRGDAYRIDGLTPGKS